MPRKLEFELTPEMRKRSRCWSGRRRARGFGLALTAAVVLARAVLADDPVPKGFPPERYAQIWERNPFTLVTPATPQAAPSAFDKLALVSWFQGGNKALVFIQNTETNEVQKVTTAPNTQGLRLVEIRPSPNPQNVEAVITNGAEQGSVRFRMDAQNAAGVSAVPGSAAIAGGVPNVPVSPVGAPEGVPTVPVPQPGSSPNVPGYHPGAATNQTLNGPTPVQGRSNPGNYPRMPNAADYRRRRVLPAPNFSPPQPGPNNPGRVNQD